MNWMGSLHSLKHLSLDLGGSYFIETLLRNNEETLEYLHFVESIHPLELLAGGSYSLPKLRTLDISIPLYSMELASNNVKNYDIRTLKVEITTRRKPSGSLSVLIALFRILRSLSPYLEHFEYNMSLDDLTVFNEVDYTMAILESLPIWHKLK